MKRLCCECGRNRERGRRALCDTEGYIHFVCPQCWKELDYIDFFFKVPKPEASDG